MRTKTDSTKTTPTRSRILATVLISLVCLVPVQAYAVVISSDFFATGTAGSGIEAAAMTGTRPGNIYVSGGSNGNALAISAIALGLLPFADSNIDALHFGEARATLSQVVFSVDFGSNSGVPGSGVDNASGTGTRPANIYHSSGNGNNSTLYSGPGLGFEPFQDSNLSAFDFGDPAESFDFAPTVFPPLGFPVYFSVDFGAQGAPGSAVEAANGTGLKPSNIYVSHGDGTNALFRSGADLGFEAFTDSNLDALFVGDDGYVYFSADRDATGVAGSALAGAGAGGGGGTGSGQKAANIYRSSGNGTNELFIAASSLGIEPFTDPDIDALSFIDVPETATLALFGLGLAGLGFSRRRRV